MYPDRNRSWTTILVIVLISGMWLTNLTMRMQRVEQGLKDHRVEFRAFKKATEAKK